MKIKNLERTIVLCPFTCLRLLLGEGFGVEQLSRIHGKG